MNRKQRRALEREGKEVTTTTEAKRFLTNDSFANLVSRTGINPGMNDNVMSQSFYAFNLVTRNRIQLEAMYRGSWVIGAVVDAVAEDMTRAGITITSNEAAEDIEDLQAGLTRLRVWNTYQDVLKWARLYGGAIGVLQISGQDLSTPLDMNRIQRGAFTGITVFDRWQITPSLTEVIRSGPDMGLPAYYYIITTQDLIDAGAFNNDKIDYAKVGLGSIKVHHSRIVRQVGVKLPYFQALTEMMWGMSEVERMFDRLVSFDNATTSSAQLIDHANLRTVQVEELREILSSGSKEAKEGLYAMFDMMRQMQTNQGLTLLDAKDKFESTAYSFAGLSDMILQFGQQLSGASGIPLVRLFGQSPAGLNSTGESDLRNYYDKINAKQEADMRPSVDKILRVTYMSMFGRPAPTDMQFTFTSLWQMSDNEKATLAQTTAQTVVGVYETGAIGKATLLKELRQMSAKTGVFTNITDEEIVEAENEIDVPVPGSSPAPTTAEAVKQEEDTISEVSLNGAQVTAMLTLIKEVSQNQIPRETAVQMMTTAFPITEAQASAILGKVGRGFKPEQVLDSVKKVSVIDKIKKFLGV